MKKKRKATNDGTENDRKAFRWKRIQCYVAFHFARPLKSLETKANDEILTQ